LPATAPSSPAGLSTISLKHARLRRPAGWAVVGVAVGAVASAALLATVLRLANVRFEYSGLLAPYIDASGGEWLRGANGTLTSQYSLAQLPGLVSRRINNDDTIRDHLVFWTWALPIVMPCVTIGLSLLLAVLWGGAARTMSSARRHGFIEQLIAGVHRALQLLAPWSFLEAFALSLLILVPDMQTVAHFIFDEGRCPDGLLKQLDADSCLDIRGEFATGTWLMVALAVLNVATAQLAILQLDPERVRKSRE